MWYAHKVRLLKTRWFNALWRRWQTRRGRVVGNYDQLAGHIRHHAPERSFVDIGCMWGVNGEFSFIAEEAGATVVKGVDVFGPTPEFEEKKRTRNSNVEFILGDATHPDTIAKIGVMDVVFCAGVLYHHPSPFDLLTALRRICGQLLILRTSTIPEIDGLPNAAVYYPMLEASGRRLWNLSSLGVKWQAGITQGFDPSQGYGNWFWGITPSCLSSLLKTAGFIVEFQAREPFAETMICRPTTVPFAHRLPEEREARAMAEEISKAGIAKPA